MSRAKVREKWTRTMPSVTSMQFVEVSKVLMATPLAQMLGGEMMSGVPAICVGGTGVGKTTIMGQIAQMVDGGFNRMALPKDGHAAFVSIPIGSDEYAIKPDGQLLLDEEGLPMLTGGKELVTPANRKFKRLYARWGSRPVIHAIDDATAFAPGEPFSIMLDFMQTRLMGDLQWKANDWIVAISNPREYAPGVRDWEPAHYGRAWGGWIDDPTPKEWTMFEARRMGAMFHGDGAKEGFLPKFDLERARREAIAAVRAHGPRIQGRIGSFLDRHPSCMSAEAAQSNSVGPEPRKWHFAQYALATCVAQGHAEFSPNGALVFKTVGGISVTEKILAGLVGNAQAAEFIGFLPMISFPAIRDVLDGKERFDFDPERPDQAMSFFSELAAVGLMDGKEVRGKQIVQFLLALPESAYDMVRGPLEDLAKSKVLDWVTMQPVLTKMGVYRQQDRAGGIPSEHRSK